MKRIAAIAVAAAVISTLTAITPAAAQACPDEKKSQYRACLNVCTSKSTVAKRAENQACQQKCFEDLCR